MRSEKTGGEELPDRALWRHCAALDMAEDEAEGFLDLAGFTDDRLDPDERERVAERLASSPAAAADVAAARALATRRAAPEAAPEHILARACALVGSRPGSTAGSAVPEGGRVVPFPAWRRSQPTLRGVARWAGLAAAIVVASWLGFALGTDSSAAFGQIGQIGQAGEDGFLHELLDPSTGFLRDLTEDAQT